MISETTTKSQRDKILEILRAAGEQGVTNFELNRVCCLRYGARIYELRKLGHNIKTVRVRGEQEFRFVLYGDEPCRAAGLDARESRAKPDLDSAEMPTSPTSSASAAESLGPGQRSESNVARGAGRDVFADARRKFFEPQLPLFGKAVRA